MLIREYAPLCLAVDPGWGGVSRGWARTGAIHNVRDGGWCQDISAGLYSSRFPFRRFA